MVDREFIKQLLILLFTFFSPQFWLKVHRLKQDISNNDGLDFMKVPFPRTK